MAIYFAYVVTLSNFYLAISAILADNYNFYAISVASVSN